MRPLLLAAFALLVLVIAPLASAQSSSVIVKLQPQEDALFPGGRMILEGTATFTSDATAYTAMPGIPVQYSVTDAPPWVSITFSKGNDVFLPPTTPGVTATSTVSFRAILDVREDAATPQIGKITIAATTARSGLTPAATGAGNVAIKIIPAEPTPCDDNLSVQSSAARPLTPPDALGGLALAGSAWGIGLGVAIAGRRPKLVGILAGLALGGLVLGFAAPTAAAQGAATSTLELSTLEPTMLPAGTATVRGTFTYFADATGYAHPAGIPVTYTIKGAPAWATVTLSPSADLLYIPATPMGTTAVATAAFTATIIIADNVTESQLGLVEIVATTAQTTATRGTATTGVTVISLRAPASCESSSALPALIPTSAKLDAAGGDADKTSASSSSSSSSDVPMNARERDAGTGSGDGAPVNVQSATNGLRNGIPILAVAGVLGALVGFVLYRRLR